MDEDFGKSTIADISVDSFVLFCSDITKVGVLTNLTFNASDAIYILKLQDGLHYHHRIYKMPAVFKSFMSKLGK